VIWNHPWFQHPENRSEWQKIHEELYKKGLISGIEVGNGDRYDPLVFKWCLDKKLTVLSNSDSHSPISLVPGHYRAMTLVLAKERSEKGIREALDNGRTIACIGGELFGKEEWVKPLIDNSLVIKARQISDKSASLVIENISGIAYKMEVADASGISLRLSSYQKDFILDALSQNAIMISSPKFIKGEEYSVRLKVQNVHVAADKPMEYTLRFKL
jgi:3',5'-nucleoside bisphosphate phosphatase